MLAYDYNKLTCSGRRHHGDVQTPGWHQTDSNQHGCLHHTSTCHRRDQLNTQRSAKVNIALSHENNAFKYVDRHRTKVRPVLLDMPPSYLREHFEQSPESVPGRWRLFPPAASGVEGSRPLMLVAVVTVPAAVSLKATAAPSATPLCVAAVRFVQFWLACRKQFQPIMYCSSGNKRKKMFWLARAPAFEIQVRSGRKVK
jgi:hypothetical protein